MAKKKEPQPEANLLQALLDFNRTVEELTGIAEVYEVRVQRIEKALAGFQKKVQESLRTYSRELSFFPGKFENLEDAFFERLATATRVHQLSEQRLDSIDRRQEVIMTNHRLLLEAVEKTMADLRKLGAT